MYISIVTIERPVTAKCIGYLLVLSYIFAFTCVAIDADGIFISLSIFFLLLFGIGAVVINKKIPVGALELSADKIRILDQDTPSYFLIEDLNKIRFKYGGYEGGGFWHNPTAIVRKDGSNNFLELSISNNNYEFEIHLKKSDLNMLNELFYHWKKINPNFKIIGEFGFEINSL